VGVGLDGLFVCVKLIMAVSSKRRFSIALYQGLSCFGKKMQVRNAAIFDFVQNGTSQFIASNSSNGSDLRRKIIYPLKISANGGTSEGG
jgi:hypothetical protein